jgi:hypothetical protein
MNPTSCMFGSRFACAQLRSFRRTVNPKMRERHQLFFGLWLMSKEFQHPAIQTKTEQHLDGLFHKIKVHQPIRRQDSMQTMIPTSRLDLFPAQNFKVFLNIQE